MLVEDTDAAPVPFALMFQFEGDKRETRHVIYKCTAQRPNVEGETTDTEIEPKTETLEANEIPYTRTEIYIEDEQLFEVAYETEVLING